jgi:chaperonin cofactor prefoldin
MNENQSLDVTTLYQIVGQLYLQLWSSQNLNVELAKQAEELKKQASTLQSVLSNLQSSKIHPQNE